MDVVDNSNSVLAYRTVNNYQHREEDVLALICVIRLLRNPKNTAPLSPEVNGRQTIADGFHDRASAFLLALFITPPRQSDQAFNSLFFNQLLTGKDMLQGSATINVVDIETCNLN